MPDGSGTLEYQGYDLEVKPGRSNLIAGFGLVVLLWAGTESAAGGSIFHSDGNLDSVGFRSVLCVVAPYNSSVQPASGRLSASSCTAESLLSTNLGTTPSDNVTGYTVNTVSPDTR